MRPMRSETLVATSLGIVTTPEMVSTLLGTYVGGGDESARGLPRPGAGDQDEIRDDGECPFCGEPLMTVEIQHMVGGRLIRERCKECGTTVELYRTKTYWAGTHLPRPVSIT